MLIEIQESAQNYTSFLGELIKADIEVVDIEKRKLCGVGVCDLSDALISRGAIYDAVFETGKRVFIDNPRKHVVCENCSNRQRCLEQLEIAVPITTNGQKREIIGAIGLVAGNRAGREQILGNARAYMFMLESVCAFLAEKAADAAEIRRLEHDLALFKNDAKSAEAIRRVEDLENEEIRRALYAFGSGANGKKKAAEALGIGIATLYRKISAGGDIGAAV